MIGKALLSGLWVCPEHRDALFALSHLSSCFTFRLTLCVSPLSLRPGVAGVCFGVPSCESLCLDGLCHVISGILAGGIPGFRMVLLLLHSLAGMAWWSGCLVLICCFAIPYGDDTKLSPLASINPFPYELEPVTMLFCLCWLFFGLFGFVSLCAFGVFVLFLLCLGDYIVTVHRTT